MKKLDLYIIRKFLGTFFFSLVLILCIVVVFDLSEKLEKEKEESITGFGRTDEERYAMLERMQQEARKVRGKRITALFKEEEEEPSNEQQMEIPNKHFELDIRQAIIASEILNRKY